MKIRKKPAMVISFALGSILFASTAFAEINSKSGYVQLKDAIKYTAESAASKLSSYTVDMSMVMKDNGNIISSDNEVIKYDVTKSSMENKTTRINEGKTTEGYNYSDKNGYISFNKEQDIYDVNNLEKAGKGSNFTNPFKEKQATDMEKIADALIGNLKDSVVVTQNTDGTKQLAGTISETQIPAIANALVSYGLKSSFLNSYNNNSNVQTTSLIPKITDDIYVKEIKGDMTLNKDGLIQSAMGTGLLTGKDDKGKEHKLTFELLVKISDVNKTVVKKPDLTGKKVQTSTQKDDPNKIDKPAMYLGTYKNDIAIEKDGKFQKIGERFVDITSLDEKSVSGSYHEEYTKGNEAYASKARNFKFVTKFQSQSQNQYNGNIEATDSLGNKVSGYIGFSAFSSGINFGINEEQSGRLTDNGQYSRVFK